MNTINDSQTPRLPEGETRDHSLLVVKKLAIWAVFLGVLYLARDFFFTAFMTFLFSYMTLAVVAAGMRRLSADRERPWLRRLLTVSVFVLTPLILLGIAVLVGPHLLDQGQRLAGWLSRVNPEGEVSRLLEHYIGPAEFKEHYGSPQDKRYQEALEEFRKSGESHVEEYKDFPTQEAWIEAGFSKQYTEAEAGKIRSRLNHETTSGQAFTKWFLNEKVPQLKEQVRKEMPEKGRPAAAVDPLVRAAATLPPEQLLATVRRDPTTLEPLRKEWVTDTLERDLALAKSSPAYLDRFKEYYEERRAKSPQAIPYTFDQYIELQHVRPQGARAFGDALEKMNPTAEQDRAARLRTDFETAKRHELFEQWWGDSPTAKLIRSQVEGASSGGAHLEGILTSLLNVPIGIGTALMLSLFICLDFPRLKRGFQGLRNTWLRDVYDEIVPALRDLGNLIGLSMHAQGLIALCNAFMLFVALTFLGVEHALLLAGAVFVLCLVPTLGTILAWVLIAAVALVQPGGGLMLALKASGAVLVVILVETIVLSPRILGRMMELHPVLIMTILPLAQYFFGVWGLILATPVAVYVVYELIFRQGLPGAHHEPAAEAKGAGPTTTEGGA